MANNDFYGNDFYGDQDLQNIENLSRAQAQQSPLYGDQAAKYADPFMSERGKYQKKLSDLIDNPGSFASSPAYKFAYDQGLDAVNRKGSVHSGNKLAQLEQYGQDKASQLYFPQAQLLSNLAISGSSPSSAGLSYARGTERGQDYQQLASATRGARNTAPQGPQPLSWIDQAQQNLMQRNPSGAPSTAPVSALPYYGNSGGMSGQVDYNTPGYKPSSYAGKSYGGYDPSTDPYWMGGDMSGDPQFDPDQEGFYD